MKEYDEYIIPPTGPDDVATIPYWLFELVRVKARRRLKQVFVLASVLIVALIVALAWR